MGDSTPRAAEQNKGGAPAPMPNPEATPGAKQRGGNTNNADSNNSGKPVQTGELKPKQKFDPNGPTSAFAKSQAAAESRSAEQQLKDAAEEFARKREEGFKKVAVRNTGSPEKQVSKGGNDSGNDNKCSAVGSDNGELNAAGVRKEVARRAILKGYEPRTQQEIDDVIDFVWSKHLHPRANE